MNFTPGPVVLRAFVATAMGLASIPLKAAEDPLARGAYLMRGIVACGNCHTPKGADGRPLPDQELSGGGIFGAPVFHAIAGNITPDKATGIGNWTDEQISNSIRNGKRPDGSTIGPPMPIECYRTMSDTDASAIVAYLRSIQPVSNWFEKSTYKIALPEAYGPVVTHVPDVPRADKIAYGQYLANIGHCVDCHTPMVNDRLDLTRVGGGGRKLHAPGGGVIVSSNLTSGNPDGIAHWTDTQVEATITTGVRPDGRRLVRLMAFDWYKNIAPDDLHALVAYLRTLPPAEP